MNPFFQQLVNIWYLNLLIINQSLTQIINWDQNQFPHITPPKKKKKKTQLLRNKVPNHRRVIKKSFLHKESIYIRQIMQIKSTILRASITNSIKHRPRKEKDLKWNEYEDHTENQTCIITLREREREIENLGRAKVKKLKQREGIRTVYGKHTTLYLRFERMKRRRGKHTTCIIDVELLLFFSFFFWSSPTLIVFSVVGNGQRLRFLSVCSRWAEIKMRVHFLLFFLVVQWEFDTLICLYHAILANNVFGYFSCYSGKVQMKIGTEFGCYIYIWTVGCPCMEFANISCPSWGWSGSQIHNNGGGVRVCVWDMTQIISLIILVSCVFKHGYVLFIQKEKH